MFDPVINWMKQNVATACMWFICIVFVLQFVILPRWLDVVTYVIVAGAVWLALRLVRKHPQTNR